MLEKDSKKVVLLTSRVSPDDPLDPDSTIDYINDVAVASDGIIYFTDSVQGIMPRRNAYGFWDTMEAYMLTLFQVRCTCSGANLQISHLVPLLHTKMMKQVSGFERWLVVCGGHAVQ